MGERARAGADCAGVVPCASPVAGSGDGSDDCDADQDAGGESTGDKPPQSFLSIATAPKTWGIDMIKTPYAFEVQADDTNGSTTPHNTSNGNGSTSPHSNISNGSNAPHVSNSPHNTNGNGSTRASPHASIADDAGDDDIENVPQNGASPSSQQSVFPASPPAWAESSSRSSSRGSRSSRPPSLSFTSEQSAANNNPELSPEESASGAAAVHPHPSRSLRPVKEASPQTPVKVLHHERPPSAQTVQDPNAAQPSRTNTPATSLAGSTISTTGFQVCIHSCPLRNEPRSQFWSPLIFVLLPSHPPPNPPGCPTAAIAITWTSTRPPPSAPLVSVARHRPADDLQRPCQLHRRRGQPARLWAAADAGRARCSCNASDGLRC